MDSAYFDLLSREFGHSFRNEWKLRTQDAPLRVDDSTRADESFGTVAEDRAPAEYPPCRRNGGQRADCEQRPSNRPSSRLLQSAGREKSQARAEGTPGSRDERHFRDRELDLTHIVPPRRIVCQTARQICAFSASARLPPAF